VVIVPFKLCISFVTYLVFNCSLNISLLVYNFTDIFANDASISFIFSFDFIYLYFYYIFYLYFLFYIRLNDFYLSYFYLIA